MTNKNKHGRRFIALLLTLSMLLSLVPGMAFAAPNGDKAGKATEQQLPDGTYSVPIYGFSNLTNQNFALLQDPNYDIYPNAVLNVQGGKVKMTIRVAGFKQFDNIFVLKQSNNQRCPGGNLNKLPVNKAELSQEALNHNFDSAWKGYDVADVDEQGCYLSTIKGAQLIGTPYPYYKTADIHIERSAALGYADITFPVEDIHSDVVVRMFQNFKVSYKPNPTSRPKLIYTKDIAIDMDEANVRQLDPLPTENGTYTWYPLVAADSKYEVGNYTPKWLNDQDSAITTDRLQGIFADNVKNMTVTGHNASITFKVKDASVTDIDEMTQRTGAAEGTISDRTIYDDYNRRYSFINADYDESVVYNASSQTLTLNYDLSNYNDMVFGKRIKVKTTDEQTINGQKYNDTSYYAAIRLSQSPMISKELSDANNGVVFKTDNYNAPEGASFVADLIEPTEAIKKKIDSAYTKYLVYDTKLMNNGAEFKPTRMGTLKIPVPEGWATSDIEVREINDSNQVTEMPFTIKDNYIEIPTNIMSKFAVGLKYNYETMDTNLADGTWKVNVASWHMYKNEPSMSNQAITTPAYLVIKNSGKDRFLYLDTKQVTMDNPKGGEPLSSYLSSMLIFKEGCRIDEYGLPHGETYPAIPYVYHKDKQGKFTEDEFNKGTLRFYPERMLIKLPSNKAEFPVKFRVPVMDDIDGTMMEREARFRIDYAKAEEVEGQGLESLNLKPSLTALKDAFNEQKATAQFAIDNNYKSKYTEASWNKMLSAYEEAKLLDVEKATEEELIASFNKLYDGIYGLRENIEGVLDADKVDALIAQIGEVSLSSEPAIQAARQAYTEFDKKYDKKYNAYVTKYDILVAAEARLQELKAAQPVEPSTPDESTIPQGTYTVPVNMMQYGKPRFPSMGNKALNGDALVVVGPNSTSYSINMKGITITEGNQPMYGHLLNMWHYDTDTSSAKTVASRTNLYKDINLQGEKSNFYGTFTMTRNGEPEDQFLIEVQVDAMDEIAKPESGKQDARLVFDWDSRVSGDHTTPVVPEIKPGEVQNEDGSITKTEKLEDGTVVETTTGKPDGSTNEKTTKPDGTIIDKTTDKAGNIDEKTSKPDGTTIDKSVKTDGLTTETTTTKEGKVSAEVTVPEGQKNVKVTIPKKDLKPGEVAVITKADGSKEVIKKSVAGEEGLNLLLDENTKLEIVDNSKTFNDVKEENWANPAIDFVTSREIFNGTGDSTFAPEATMTRGMLVQVLYNFENRPEGAKAGDFGDVKDDAWFADAVAWAADNKIVAGVGDNNFAPEQEISREQLVTILYRYAGAPKVNGSLDKYSDASKVSSYAQDAMLWAVENGIVSGMGNNTLAPQGDATRAQVAQIMMNFCDFII